MGDVEWAWIKGVVTACVIFLLGTVYFFEVQLPELARPCVQPVTEITFEPAVARFDPWPEGVPDNMDEWAATRATWEQVASLARLVEEQNHMIDSLQLAAAGWKE